MTEEKKEKKSYIKRLFAFYFAPVWYSFLTILYLLFFLYFTIFYSGHILTAYRFLIYTFKNSASLLGLDYLFYGVAFLITLVIPFSISLYSILFLYDIWNVEKKWTKDRKILITVIIIIIIPLVIILIDNIIRIITDVKIFREFLILNDLLIKA